MMDDHVLLVGALEVADWLHLTTAVAQPISWLPVIDMPRVEAERAVVAMTSTAGRRADETMAVPALKHLIRGLLITRLAMASMIIALILVGVRAVVVVSLCF